MSRSISRASSAMAWDTPGSPAYAAAKRNGADKDGARTERKGLDDVGAAAEAAIDHDGDIACLFQDASQRLHRRDSVVQLSAAMICEDDPVHAAISCQGSVCGREDALDDQRCLPQTAYQPDVAPAQSLMWGNTGNLSREQPWSAPRFQIVDMRIFRFTKMHASTNASQRGCVATSQLNFSPSRIGKPKPARSDCTGPLLRAG